MEDTLPAASARGADPVRGDAIDRYIVLDVIGRGGMGVVVSAYDPELDRRVAVKLFAAGRTSAAGDSAGQLRLVREAQAMARLSHPNVVPVYDAGTWAGGVFVAMELIDGTTLGTWGKDPARTWQEMISAYILAGRGLAAAHAAGMIHRDFKPDNVLVATTGAVKVTDFGLVTLRGEVPGPRSAAEVPTQDATDLTVTGTIMGTPRYMAPEQFAGRDLDARSDQFSFCASLYEALWRHAPFAGATFAAIAASVLDGDLRDPEPASPVPAAIRAAILRGLALAPRDRHPSMEALLAALTIDPPGRRRTAYAAVAALVIAGGGYALAARSDAAEQCPLPPADLDGAWSDARKATIGERFAATGRSFARLSADDAIAGLDAYLASWAAARRDACRAARAVSARAGADRRLACLDRRREDALALIEVLSAPDDATVTMASQAVARLPPIADCTDAALGPRLAPAPEAAARVAQLQRELASARALADAGHYRDARARADRLAADADALAYPPLRAEIGVVRGDLQASSGEVRAARDTLLDAAALARRHGLAEVEAAAWHALSASERMGADHQASLAAARMAGALAAIRDDRRGAIDAALREAWALAQLGAPAEGAAVIERLGPQLAVETRLDWRLAGHLAEARAVIASAQGDSTTAYRVLSEARDRMIEHLGPEHPELAYLDNRLAGEAYALGRPDEARRLIGEARALARDAGVRDAGAAELAVNAVVLASDLGADPGPELAAAEALVAGLPSDGVMRLALRNARGLIAFRAGRFEDALAHYRFVAERGAGRNAAIEALANENAAKALTMLGRPAEAIAPLDRALELRTAMEPDPRRAALTRGMRARVLAADDRYADALPDFEAALRALATPPPGRAGEVAELTVAYAVALTELGRAAEAGPIAAPALDALRAAGNDYYLGLALTMVADDRWTRGDHDGALAAAREGRAALVRDGTSADEVAELDRWLASHRAGRAR